MPLLFYMNPTIQKSILRNKPRSTYCGLTIILSNPSRWDISRLLSGNGGVLFEQHCLRPDYNSMQCDVRLMSDKSPLLDGTKCILILGEFAAWSLLPETNGQAIGSIRGGLYTYKGIPAICSFLPQDAADNFKNYEKTHNPLATDYTPDDKISDDDEDDEGDVKAFGKTKRANYAFWLKADTNKCKSILKRGQNKAESILQCSDIGGRSGIVGGEDVAKQSMVANYRIYPAADTVINLLTNTKGQYLYFDIETDYEQQNLQCFAFSFDGVTTYSVPTLDYNYKPAYANLFHILKALAVAIRDNTVVAHNGASFDFFVLAYKYRIPIVKTYDTMIAHHRCFPDIEKSLGHCVSYWTYERFHKDEDSHSYRSKDQMMARLTYCAKDVYTMFLVKQGIDAYAKKIPGLSDSINIAMSMIRPYLTMTLHGIKCNEEKVKAIINENDRLMMQYNRMIELLIGPSGMLQITEGKKVSMMAGSNKQCCKYFHDILGYKVMGYGKPKDDGTKSPSLGKKALYKLALEYDNPVITLICAFRAVAKETSRLNFTPFKSPYYL